MELDRYREEPFWKRKRLTPAQLLVHDVGLETLVPGKDPRLEIIEVLSSTLIPDTSRLEGEKGEKRLEAAIPVRELGSTRTENQRLEELRQEYGWLHALRKPAEEGEGGMCRWIHVSSKFSEYLQGIFLGLSDWSVDPAAKLEQLRELDRCVYEYERFSKHGKYFSPFCRRLAAQDASEEEECPILLSIPYLDWTVNPGPAPPLRFQVDKHEGYQSVRSSSHPMRSILQHYYRLEETSDRERTQVFTRHKPWNTNRDLDLKVRRWYGRYPSGLNVDELWMLILDESTIVTFASNQSWKSRWPPLQLAYRVAEVSFRGIRDEFFHSERRQRYTAFIHAVACVHGAVGMIHRSFWPDLPLPCTDRYGGYLGHLQYRLHRAPSAKLVTDLMQVQDELNIVLQISKKQEEVVSQLQEHMKATTSTFQGTPSRRVTTDSGETTHGSDLTGSSPQTKKSSRGHSSRSAIPVRHGLRHDYVFKPPDPMDEVLDHIRREYDDLKELRDNANELITRTVQLVNIRLEDHGQAILVFTVVTIIFLPLSFVASFFGMNVSDIREMSGSQAFFWAAASALTVVVVALSLLLAFYGNTILEHFINWKDNIGIFKAKERAPPPVKQSRPPGDVKQKSFTVFDIARVESAHGF